MDSDFKEDLENILSVGNRKWKLVDRQHIARNFARIDSGCSSLPFLLLFSSLFFVILVFLFLSSGCFNYSLLLFCL